MNMRKLSCNECSTTTELNKKLEEGEIVTCPICGCEHYVKNGELLELVYEGCDYGE